ncbi:MAG: hypothetical protein ACPGXL_00695 [Chitinophagales bacterium]
MTHLLINLTNHPISTWNGKQLETAQKQFTDLKDIAFPHISPSADDSYITELANGYVEKILRHQNEYDKVTVHVMGEMTFVLSMVCLLQQQGVTCIASTTNRNAIEYGNGVKTVRFNFVRFRKYPSMSYRSEEKQIVAIPPNASFMVNQAKPKHKKRLKLFSMFF